jgi:hypothetical protein
MAGDTIIMQIAIPLSSITIVGGCTFLMISAALTEIPTDASPMLLAIANFLLNIRKSRSTSTEPLIDWDFVLVMQPVLLST